MVHFFTEKYLNTTMNFKNWLNVQITELFDKSTFMQTPPENGYWSPPLTQNDGEYTFYYSVPSDPQKSCDGPNTKKTNACYYVHFVDGDIGFGHKSSFSKDRWNDNQTTALKNNVNPMQIATESLNAILWAVGQYVQTVNPKKLTWFPQPKSNLLASNPYARGKIYFMWAAKNLYPQYVPVHFSIWERQDYFLSNQEQLLGKQLFNQENIQQMNAKQFLDKLTEFQQFEKNHHEL